MTHIQLPISKSIANRVLVLQALNGEPLMDVSAVSIPEDVRLMHNALDAITHGADEVNVENCGTAMRFLTAYCAQLEGQSVVINCSERMKKRPIKILVDALRSLGAEISYLEEDGFVDGEVRGSGFLSQVIYRWEQTGYRGIAGRVGQGPDDLHPDVEYLWAKQNAMALILLKFKQKDGSAFAGWYDGNNPFDFNSEVITDMTLTAKWASAEFT